MTRYFKGEMSIIKTSGKLPDNVRFVCGTTSGGDFTFTVVKNSERSVELPLNTTTLHNRNLKFLKYLYSKEKRPVDSKGFPVPVEENISFEKDTFNLKVPAKCVMLFTSYKSGE